MIYVCIPSHDEAQTVGLLLWKVRKVFAEFGREYQFLVADDGSTDETSARLAPYAKVLPLTVVRNPVRQGVGASIERLLRLALERSDRPKRDCAVVMHADFTHSPE
ncbi:MAG TPA: glycosyltransferase, partial [Gemmatimonadales bacterium]